MRAVAVHSVRNLCTGHRECYSRTPTTDSSLMLGRPHGIAREMASRSDRLMAPIMEECMDTPSVEPSVESAAPSAATPTKSVKPKRDPLVTTLWLIIFAIIVITLATVAYGLLTNLFGTGAPRTMAQYRIMSAEAKIKAGSKFREDWVGYISALIDDGQYRQAQNAIDKGKKLVEKQDISADMLYMQATLDFAQGDVDKALKIAEEAQKQIRTTHEKALAKQKKTGNPTEASVGLHDNYYELVLLKAEVFEKKKDWKKALAAYDEYLKAKPTAASVVVLRGAVKEQLGDKKGAEADYRGALMFIPDDPAALAGLKRIGAKQ